MNKLAICYIFCILVVSILAGCATKTKLIITPLKTTEAKLSKILAEFQNTEYELIVNRKYDTHTYSHSVIVHSPGFKAYSLAMKIRKKESRFSEKAEFCSANVQFFKVLKKCQEKRNEKIQTKPIVLN